MEVVMGMIYKRGRVWWIKYHRNGKPNRESSKSTKKMVAESTQTASSQKFNDT